MLKNGFQNILNPKTERSDKVSLKRFWNQFTCEHHWHEIVGGREHKYASILLCCVCKKMRGFRVFLDSLDHPGLCMDLQDKEIADLIKSKGCQDTL